MKLLVLTLIALSAPAAGWLLSPDPSTGPRSQERTAQGPQDDDSAAQVDLQALLERAGIGLDLQLGVCSVEGRVEITDQLLEYLMVMLHGAAHESLFVIGHGKDIEELITWTEVFNAALLTLGLAPGRNADWVAKDPPPTEQELRAGASSYDVVPPQGDGLFLYAAWQEGDEVFFYRVEDLVRDLERGRTMRRHCWVYLGSRMVQRVGSDEQVFAAAVEGNLINITFFAQGNTVLTGALAECINQTSWLPNAWLLPPMGSDVLLLFSRRRLESVPAAFADRLPGRPAEGR